ncbi:hypothetical protein ACH5RR_038910 [Cinchona calisaya]|uniref:Pectinesterase inhibitor domain-containing protein n=1 Tax=Cinchona calisaya TaxID=153742 RepID=A0ABD2Y1W9_9GENT
MRHFCICISISISLLFPLLIPPTNSTFLMIKQHSDDTLVNSTCKQCADISTIFDYNFCITSLQTDPLSHHLNLPGLAVLAMELAYENATSTVKTIEKMIGSKEFDPFATECLRDCLELYANSVSKIVMAIGAFLKEQFGAATVFLSVVVEETMSCEAEFRQKKGEATPLVKENYDLFELSIIGLCIINLVSLYPS